MTPYVSGTCQCIYRYLCDSVVLHVRVGCFFLLQHGELSFCAGKVILAKATVRQFFKTLNKNRSYTNSAPKTNSKLH